MIARPWGTPWLLKYKPQVGGEYITPTGNPDIFIFRDQPNEAQARNGSGALHTVSNWSYDASINTATATIPAINDPQDGTKRWMYWIAINYAISGGSQKQLDLRSFWVMAPDGMVENPVPTVSELKEEYDTTLGAHYRDDADILKFIQRAERDVKRDLKWRGYGWPRVQNVGDLRDAICCKALTFIYLDLTDDPNDIYSSNYKEYKELYDRAVTSINIIEEDEASVEKDVVNTPPQPAVTRWVR